MAIPAKDATLLSRANFPDIPTNVLARSPELADWWKITRENLQREFDRLRPAVTADATPDEVTQAEFDGEVAAREAGDDAEEAARIAADANLQGQVDSKATIVALNNEASTREAGDTALDVTKADKGPIGSAGFTMSTGRMLGRYSAGAGAPEEINLFNVTTTAISLAMTADMRNVVATAACTVTLPPSATVVAGQPYTITARADNVIAAGDGTDTVMGDASFTLYDDESLTVYWDGVSDWQTK